MRKLVAFDDETFHQLQQLGRDRMATLQELMDEAVADLLRKHGVPRDLREALRRSTTPGSAARAGKPIDGARRRTARKSRARSQRSQG
jgi:hypothetical protein